MSEFDHEPKPLPDPLSFPYGMVRLVIWQPTEGHDSQWSGHEYTNRGDVWKSWRGHPREFLVGEEVDWRLDGYRFDYFNRGWLLDPKHNPGPLVRLAMWALDRWAVDVGLKERPDKARVQYHFEKVDPGQILDIEI